MKIYLKQRVIYITIIFFIFGLYSLSWAKNFASIVNKGVELYKAGKYDEALKTFTDAQIEKPEDTELKYNIATTHYKMKNYEEAIKTYADVITTSGDTSLQEKSYYNLGNCFYRQGKLQEAVVAYQKALELDPNDMEAKHNLEFVQEEIKRMINEAKKREEEQKKEGDNQQGEKNQQNQSEQNQSEENQGEQTSQSGENQEEQKQQGEEGESGEESSSLGENQQGEGEQGVGSESQEGEEKEEGVMLTPQQAEQLLNSLKEDQKELLKERMKKKYGKGYSIEKWW